jgi:hypothetical protein
LGPNAQQAGQGSGGAVSSIGAQLTINNSVISGNSAVNYGGGVYITTSTVNINNTTVSNNVANTNNDIYGEGGGVWIRAEGVVTVTGSTISGNRTNRNADPGPNPDLRFAGHGGGVWVQGILTVNNSTVSGNFAELNGGGFYVSYSGGGSGVLNLNSSTIVNNAAAGTGGVWWWDTLGHPPVNIRNTIIANNGADVSGTFTSQGYNLIRNPTGATITGGTGNLTGVDPLLGPLANNGGARRYLVYPAQFTRIHRCRIWFWRGHSSAGGLRRRRQNRHCRFPTVERSLVYPEKPARIYGYFIRHKWRSTGSRRLRR